MNNSNGDGSDLRDVTLQFNDDDSLGAAVNQSV
jgi:hypothetical protein